MKKKNSMALNQSILNNMIRFLMYQNRYCNIFVYIVIFVHIHVCTCENTYDLNSTFTTTSQRQNGIYSFNMYVVRVELEIYFAWSEHIDEQSWEFLFFEVHFCHGKIKYPIQVTLFLINSKKVNVMVSK